ncbi:MAG: succinate dehydrogenase cytochrome b subunit [Saprospiraceae bacterium]|nr:succinate dehydrogenase cytochrome b subunit [Saprospiraceae bacterium]
MKNWFFRFFTSSIGKKLIMSLTGIFLILFLVVHLAGNLQLLNNDEGESFNVYSEFMAHNAIIQTISKGNFFFILLHVVIGTGLWLKNRQSRGSERYAVQVTRATQTNAGFAKNMWFLGVIVFVFIIVHLAQFWAVMKFGNVGSDVRMVSYGGEELKDLYSLVATAFTNLGYVIFYVVCMAVIAFHLWHGFQSAFQTIGFNHPKYTPAIHFLGKAYAVLIPLGFAIIPIIFYLKHT